MALRHWMSGIMAIGAVHLGGCYSHLAAVDQPDAAVDQRYSMARTIENIVFTEQGWPQELYADLYLPQRRGPVPVVLMIHGGGWAARSREDMADISEKLVRNGYAVFNASYRFAPKHRHPAQVHDLQQALAWIQRNADRYRLDLERINTWGYSSGAHLAALIGSYDPSDAALDPRVPLPRIRAVVAGGIPSDLTKYDSSPIVSRFLGGERNEMPQRYAEASPVHHISSDDPPVFLYHGRLDWLVTQDQASDYYAALREAGVDAELYIHRWLGHMTLFVLGGDVEDKAIAFLNRQNIDVPKALAAAKNN